MRARQQLLQMAPQLRIQVPGAAATTRVMMSRIQASKSQEYVTSAHHILQVLIKQQPGGGKPGPSGPPGPPGQPPGPAKGQSTTTIQAQTTPPPVASPT